MRARSLLTAVDGRVQPVHRSPNTGQATGLSCHCTPNAGHPSATAGRADPEHRPADQNWLPAHGKHGSTDRNPRVAHSECRMANGRAHPADSEHRSCDQTRGSSHSEGSAKRLGCVFQRIANLERHTILHDHPTTNAGRPTRSSCQRTPNAGRPTGSSVPADSERRTRDRAVLSLDSELGTRGQTVPQSDSQRRMHDPTRRLRISAGSFSDPRTRDIAPRPADRRARDALQPPHGQTLERENGGSASWHSPRIRLSSSWAAYALVSRQPWKFGLFNSWSGTGKATWLPKTPDGDPFRVKFPDGNTLSCVRPYCRTRRRRSSIR